MCGGVRPAGRRGAPTGRFGNPIANATDSHYGTALRGAFRAVGHRNPGAAPRGQGGYPRRMKTLVRWGLLAAALLLVAHLYPGVTVRSFGAALIAALVLGLLNALVRPILVLLTLPVTLLTLGLFLFVVNAAMFYLAASLLDGLQVAGFGAALIGSLLYSVCAMVIDVALERLFARGG